MRAVWLLLFSLSVATRAFSETLPVTYEASLDAAQQEHVSQSVAEVLDLLPDRIKRELPNDLSLIITDLNRNLPKMTEDACATQDPYPGFRDGRYYALTQVIAIDYRVAWCGGKRLQATLLHELVHAWDRASLTGYRLSTDRAWLSLGYWDRGWILPQQSNADPQRLVDEGMYRNPQEFLAINIEHFLLDEDWRCRQPALFRFFNHYFQHEGASGSVRDCSKPLIVHHGEWPVIKHIDAARVYRIDYLLAAAGDDLVSNFGHSMFRLVICAPARYSPLIEADVAATPYGPACLRDEAFHLVVSFRANVDDAVLSYRKGLMGGYASRPFILPYPQVVEEYTSDQLRDITLYPLLLNEEQKAFFIERALESFWGYSGNYRFISNNCAIESLRLLQSVLPGHRVQETAALTPRGVLQVLEDAAIVDLSAPDIETIVSREAEFEKLYRIAYPPDLETPPAADNVADYLRSTRAEARAGWFPPAPYQSVERVAALRRLEQQIRRVQQRKLTILARHQLYEVAGDDIQALTLPWRLSALRVDGYGVPFAHELFMDEEALVLQHRELKIKTIEWIKHNETEAWREHERINHNLESLDILAVRKVD